MAKLKRVSDGWRGGRSCSGVSKDTLRRWDRAGKLEARRHPITGYRLYPAT